MNAVWELHLVVNHIEQQLIRQASAFLVFGAAVYDFLKDYVCVLVMLKVGEGDNPLEIPAMPVEVAGYDN
jgi:hypothetical protein